MRTQVVALGEVHAPETGLSDLTLRSGGFVERLYVEESGAQVKKGQPVLELYSPEILEASEELLAAQRTME